MLVVLYFIDCDLGKIIENMLVNLIVKRWIHYMKPVISIEIR